MFTVTVLLAPDPSGAHVQDDLSKLNREKSPKKASRSGARKGHTVRLEELGFAKAQRRLLREVVELPSLGAFQSQADMVLRDRV